MCAYSVKNGVVHLYSVSAEVRGFISTHLAWFRSPYKPTNYNYSLRHLYTDYAEHKYKAIPVMVSLNEAIIILSEAMLYIPTEPLPDISEYGLCSRTPMKKYIAHVRQAYKCFRICELSNCVAPTEPIPC